MVYLVDDTPLEKTGQYIDLGEYADVIERIGEASPDTLGRMSDAECVLIHSSFTDKLFIKAVKRDVCGFGDDVPLVLFSDGNPQEVEFDGDRFIVSIRKDRMYSNLGAFLQRFRIDRKPDLKILAYGEHYSRERASALAGAVLSAMMFQPGEEVVDPAHDRIRIPLAGEQDTRQLQPIWQEHISLVTVPGSPSPSTSGRICSRCPRRR